MGPLHWQHGVLATRPPGKSLSVSFSTTFKTGILKKPFFFFFFKTLCVCVYGPVLQSLLNLLTILFLFYVLLFGHEACGVLASQPGVEDTPTALDVEVLTTRLLGRSPVVFFFFPPFLFKG